MPKRHALLLTAAFAACTAATSSAHAGALFSEADLGALVFIGGASSSIAPGPSMGVRMGWGPTSWLFIGVYGGASTHEAILPPPPDGQIFQLYQAGLDVRLMARIHRIGLFLEETGGMVYINTNILDQVGITDPFSHYGTFLMTGGGIEYHIENPRFSVGLAGDFAFYPTYASTEAVSVRLYLRYTK